MTYYSKKEYSLVGFRKSTKPGKKYDALIKRKSDNKIISISFGDVNYESYGDKTGLGLYKTHGDFKRRMAYRKRHQHNIKNGYYSASLFALKKLW